MLRALPLYRGLEEYVRWCVIRKSPPRVQEFAACLGRSRGWLVAKLVAETGQPPVKCLKREQVRLAEHLLTGTNLSVARVGYMAGFGTRRTFHRAFQAIVLTTPGDYRSREGSQASPPDKKGDGG